MELSLTCTPENVRSASQPASQPLIRLFSTLAICKALGTWWCFKETRGRPPKACFSPLRSFQYVS